MRNTLRNAVVVAVTLSAASCAPYDVPHAHPTRGAQGPQNGGPYPPGGWNDGPAAVSRPGRIRTGDPRYRPARGLEELREVSLRVGRATGRGLGGKVIYGASRSPICRVRGTATNAVIEVNPGAAKVVPPNSWAFIFGHEFAHQTKHMGTHDATNPTKEREADLLGARYAMAAGYKLEPFLGWMMKLDDDQSTSHGSTRARARVIARHYRVSEAVLQEEMRKYPAQR